jgi:ubiquinone/menaquinone biosynthesis C-methylase UbiE
MSYLNRQYYVNDNAIVSLFDELSLWSSYFGRILMDNVPLRKVMTVLDVGCGTGFPLLELAQRLDPLSRLTGIDVWENAVKRAIWKKEQYELTNVEVICCDAATMPFPDKKFDLVVSNLGINNFDNPAKVLSECYRVLKRPGKLCLTTNLEGHYMEFYSVFEATLKELGKESLLPKLKAQEQHRGTDETVRDLLESARFSVLKTIRERFAMRFVDGSAMLRHFLTVVGFLPGWRSVLAGEDESAIFSLLEKKLNDKAEWEGELKMTVPMLYVEAIK